MKKFLAVLYTILFTCVVLVFILAFTFKSYLGSNFYTNLVKDDKFMQTKIYDSNLNLLNLEEDNDLCSNDCTIEEAVIKISSDEFGIKKELTKVALQDKDIQKALGNFISTYINLETTGKQNKIDYQIYEKALDKEISQKILKEKNITKEDIKQLIDQYNKGIETYNN